MRQTCIRSDAKGFRTSESGLEFEVALRPKESVTVELEICCRSEVADEIDWLFGGVVSARFEFAEMAREFPRDHEFELALQRLDGPLDLRP